MSSQLEFAVGSFNRAATATRNGIPFKPIGYLGPMGYLVCCQVCRMWQNKHGVPGRVWARMSECQRARYTQP